MDLSIDSIPDLEGDDLEDAFAGVLRSVLDEVHERITPTLGSTKVVGCRITLTGRSRIHERVRRIVADGTVQDGQKRDHDGVIYFVEKIVDLSAPAFDLDRIARGSDPPALLAQRLIHLQENQSEAQTLVRAAAEKINGARAAVLGSESVDVQPLDASDVGVLLQRAGFEALEDLLAQHGNGVGDTE